MFEGSIVLTKLGNSIGFYITERMVDVLKIKTKDKVDITIVAIFNKGVPKETHLDFLNEQVIKSGKYGGIILDKKKLDSNELTAGMTIKIEMTVVK